MVRRNITGKLVIIGDKGVGKTSLCMRYIKKEFADDQSTTIAAEFWPCEINTADAIVKLNIWDTAGEEKYKAITSIYYRSANAVLLVFDLTRPTTFMNLKMWVSELTRYIGETIVFSLIANKSDLNDTRQVHPDEAQEYAKSIGAKYFECSAKTDQCVEQIFLSIAAGIVSLYDRKRNTTVDEDVVDTCKPREISNNNAAVFRCC